MKKEKETKQKSDMQKNIFDNKAQGKSVHYEIFQQDLKDTGISNHAANILLANLSGIHEIIDLDRKQLENFPGSEWKVVREILELRRKLRNESGYYTYHEVNDFQKSLKAAGLSTTSINVLSGNVKNFQEFMELDEKLLAIFQCRGRKTFTEILEFQKNLQDEFGYSLTEKVTELKRAYSLLPEAIKHDGKFYESVKHLLGERAQNVLVENRIDTLKKFMNLTKSSMFLMQNCGSKTVAEIGRLQNKIYVLVQKICRRNAQDPVNIRSHIYKLFGNIELTLCVLPESIKQNTMFYESVKQTLSARAQNVLTKNRIDTLEKFMSLTRSSLLMMRNCGTKTAYEIRDYQRKIYNLAQKIVNENRQFSLTDSGPTDIFHEFSESTEMIDPDAPFPSLESWVARIAKMSEKKQRIFMFRMGMMGLPPMTLREVGEKFGITRERVRQIVNKLARTGRHQFHKRKLLPLVEEALEIVSSRGGRMSEKKLVSILLAHGPDGNMLKHATAFIGFLSTLEEWEDAGLRIEDGYVFAEDPDD